MSRLSDVTVRARAVIPLDGGIVVARERKRGRPHTTIPGGRVGEGETVTEAVVREVREETGLEVAVQSLLYVADVIAPVDRQDLNLIFLATPSGPQPETGVEVVELESEELILPPILDQIRGDQKQGWPTGTILLGNLWDAELRR
jgi:ADP-ribose pyrophosphatase YjhB (NUDIX family)